MLLRSESLGHTNLPRFHGEKGEPARALGISFAPAAGDQYLLLRKGDETVIQMPTDKRPAVTLVVARSTQRLDAQLVFFRWLLLASGGATMIAALVISLILVRRALRPLNALADRIATIREHELSSPIPTRHVPAELAPVVKRLNDLLRRLEAAFKRERSFTANVAHELRTPLAGALRDSLQIVERMHAMVERLLLLARLETQQVAFTTETLRVWEVVAACWQPLAHTAAARGLTLDSHIPEHLTCAVDHDSIVMVLSNLLENAVQYADRNGRITVTAAEGRDHITIAVENTGCTLTNEQAAHVFEPFWRADAARKAVGIHCGLGLAVVRQLVLALGGTVTSRVEDNGVFTARITLPSSGSA